MARRQVEQMINGNPVTLVLNRYTKIPAPDGGYTLSPTPTPLDAQVFTLIPFKRRMTEFLINTELGDVPNLEYVLLGFHTANVMRGDEFTYNNEDFKVEQLELDREVRVAAAIVYVGGQSNG